MHIGLRDAILQMQLLTQFSYPYPGELRGPDLALLGVVRRPRRLWCGCSGLPPTASPHRPTPPGGVGDPQQSEPVAPDVPGGGAHQSSPHPDVPARPHQGCLTARRCRCSGLTQHPAHTLLYREESFPWEPGDRCHRERFQRHGKRRVLGMRCKSESCSGSKLHWKYSHVLWNE